MSYQPPQIILDKYADVLVNFALNNGKGVRKNDVIFLQIPESAKPLLIALNKAVLKAGAHSIIQYIPDGISRDFFDLANNEQINFFPAHYLKGRVRQADHFLMVIAETDKHELEGIDPAKIMERNVAMKPYVEWRKAKENKNKLSWTIGLYGTQAMAKEAGLTLRQCWQQIIKACYLNHEDPIKRWQNAFVKINQTKNKLNKLNIQKIHIKSKDTDLIIGIDKNRQWVGGSGCNIPSFEIFISPDWRQTNGFAAFDQPLYRHGNIIKNIKLVFKDGVVVESSAQYGEKVLKELIKVENSDKIGEFSLTDKRISKISKFMAETLFDENFGGEFGNFHIALGSSFKDSYPGNIAKIKKEEWAEMGYNDSIVHTDLVSTEDRTITAILSNGKKKIIYKNGKFIC